MNAGLCSRLLPGRLAMVTLPARAASTRPGTPRIESLRSSSGSQNSSSTRRKITSTSFEAGERLEKNAVVAHGQILALDKLVAEIAREIGLFKIGFVVRPRREQHDARIVRIRRRELRERFLHLAKKSGQPVHLAIAKRLRQGARRDQPVRQRVAGAGGNLRAVGSHPPASVRRTRQVGGVKNQKFSVLRPDAVAGAQKIRLAKNQRGRQAAGADQILRAVAVGENAVDEFGALDKAGFERAPFVRRDEQRHRVQFPRTFHAARVAIDIVGDALFLHEPPRIFPAAFQFARADLLQRTEKFRVMRTQRAVGVRAFVKKLRRARAFGRRRLRKLVLDSTDVSFIGALESKREPSVFASLVRHCASRA